MHGHRRAAAHGHVCRKTTRSMRYPAFVQSVAAHRLGPWR